MAGHGVGVVGAQDLEVIGDQFMERCVGCGGIPGFPPPAGNVGSGVLDEGALAAKAELSQQIDQGKAIPRASPAPAPSRAGQ